jgi:hypothetical protein
LKQPGKKNQELENLIPKMGEKAPRRWYPILIIVMCIRLILQATISFRAAPKAIHIAFSHFNAVKDQPIPSHKSISRWLTQIGLYKLNCQKKHANDWALIVDNSVQIGTQKCLVILGTRLSYFRGKALTFEDMEMLTMELHDKSNANIVCKALEKAQKKVGKAAMVCADDGPDLRGGVAHFCKKHHVGRVFDITHKIGTFLKAILQKDPQWQAFSSMAAEAKKKMQQTKAAHLMPPNQRSKSRFLNIEILVHWGIDAMTALKSQAHPDKQLLEEYCGWIRNYEEFIQQLRQFVLISQNVRRHIREHGICSTTREQIDTMLEAVMKFDGFNLEACEYAGKLIDFVYEQSQIVPTGELWIGSSEIIESLFGKLKCLEHDQSKGGFTSLVLGAAACVGKIDVDVVRAALDEVKSSDVDAWTKNQIGVILLSKRRKAFGSWRKKKRTKKKLTLYMGRESTGNSLEKVMGF